MDNGPDWVILLMYWFHDMRHTGFRRLTVVNRTPEIGASQDYFTKWAEAEPLTTITEQKFDNLKFKNFYAELRIKNFYSSPTHPQSNGQAELTIWTLKAALKTKLENLKGKWVEYLPEVLWAYKTTRKSATQETQFALAFGTEMLAPVEVGVKSPKVKFVNAEQNEESLRLNLDLLEEKREQALKLAEDYQRKIARYYD